MTVSGGVSLGAYQAGATWGLLFVLRSDSALAAARRESRRQPLPPPPPTPRFTMDVLTGASAGNINALLAAATYCDSDLPSNPHQSLFWKTWIPIGFRELIDSQAAGADTNYGVFSRAAFDSTWKLLHADFAQLKHDPNCDLLIGITTTKVTPVSVQIAPGVAAPVQRFAGVFRMVATGRGLTVVQPRIGDVIQPDITDILILHPSTNSAKPVRVGDSWKVDSLSLRALVEGSGAFPVAFSPRRIPARRLDELGWDRASGRHPPCLLKSARDEVCEPPPTDRFVDGGLFDNRPLGLARQLAHALAVQRVPASTQRAVSLNSASAYSIALSACTSTDKDARAKVDSLNDLGRQLDSVRARLADSSAMDSARRNALSTVQTQLLRTIAAKQAWLESVAKALERGDRCREAYQRYAAAQDSAAQRAILEAAKSASKPHRLLYFIDDDARRGVRDDTAASRKKEAAGGLLAAVQVGLTAFETGANYEMRQFAKGAYLGDLRLEQETLAVNSRYPHLMAEHLNHFGAFLGRSFREHDFYAGVYDGLRSAFRELYCRASDSTGLASGSCDAAWLHIALDQGVLQLDSTGQAVVTRLFAHEDSLRPPPPVLRIGSTADTAKRHARAIAALVDANLVRDLNKSCTTHAFLIEAPMCNLGLVPVLTEWHEVLGVDADGLRKVLERNGDHLGALFAADPWAAYHGVLLRTLAKLKRVEDRLDQMGEQGFPGSLQVPLFLERQYNEIYRSCWFGVRNLPCVDPNPTSSDVIGGWWSAGAARALPFTVGGMRSGTSHWVGWRPTWYVARVGNISLAAVAPVEAVWAQADFGVQGGAGVLVLPPWPPLVSAISVSWMRRLDGGGFTRTPTQKDITVALLSGVVRVGYRGEEARISKLVSANNLTLGIGDANGISSRVLEWLGELTWRNKKVVGAGVAGAGFLALVAKK